jgi:hypothetical protein
MSKWLAVAVLVELGADSRTTRRAHSRRVPTSRDAFEHRQKSSCSSPSCSAEQEAMYIQLWQSTCIYGLYPGMLPTTQPNLINTPFLDRFL